MGFIRIDGNQVTLGSTVVSKPVAFTYVLSILYNRRYEKPHTVYNLVFFMQLVSTPIIIKSLGISDSDNGIIQTVFGVVQMLGGPLFGYFIQRFGIRYSLILCYLSTMLSGILLFIAKDFNMLLISRIPCLFIHGQQSHQTLLSALTQHGKERTKSFATLGITFGIGFVLTPIANIIVSKTISDHAPFIVSAMLCVFPIMVLEFCIPRKAYESHEHDEDEKEEKVVMNITNTIRILNKPGVLNVLFKKNAPIVPILLIFSILNLYMINEFHISNEFNHMSQLIIGIFIMCSNGVGLPKLRDRYDEVQLLYIGTVSFFIGYVLFLFFNAAWMMFVFMPFISLGMTLVATVSDSILTSLVEEKEQGLVLGLATSFNSLVRTLSPACAGYILQEYGFNVLPTFGCVSTLFGLAALYLVPLDRSLERKSKSKDE